MASEVTQSHGGLEVLLQTMEQRWQASAAARAGRRWAREWQQQQQQQREELGLPVVNTAAASSAVGVNLQLTGSEGGMSATSIAALSDDLLLRTLSMLDPQDLPRVAQVCRRWHWLCNESSYDCAQLDCAFGESDCAGDTVSLAFPPPTETPTSDCTYFREGNSGSGRGAIRSNTRQSFVQQQQQQQKQQQHQQERSKQQVPFLQQQASTLLSRRDGDWLWAACFVRKWGLASVEGRPSSRAFWLRSKPPFAVYHVVQRHDSVASLAVHYRTQVSDICRLNNMMSEHGIYSRSHVLIPAVASAAPAAAAAAWTSAVERTTSSAEAAALHAEPAAATSVPHLSTLYQQPHPQQQSSQRQQPSARVFSSSSSISSSSSNVGIENGGSGDGGGIGSIRGVGGGGDCSSSHRSVGSDYRAVQGKHPPYVKGKHVRIHFDPIARREVALLVHSSTPSHTPAAPAAGPSSAAAAAAAAVGSSTSARNVGVPAAAADAASSAAVHAAIVQADERRANAMSTRLLRMLSAGLGVDEPTAVFYLDNASGDIRRAFAEHASDLQWERQQRHLSYRS